VPDEVLKPNPAGGGETTSTEINQCEQPVA